MKIINLQQGTPEWKSYRTTRIGATDFAWIASSFGYVENIYNKSLNKWVDEKLSVEEELTEARKDIYAKGNEVEIIVRNYVNSYYSADFEPTVIEYSDRLYASLDGYSKKLNSIIEIKYISANRRKFKHLLPYYLAQILHQYYVSNQYVECQLWVQDAAIQDPFQYLIEPLYKEDQMAGLALYGAQDNDVFLRCDHVKGNKAYCELLISKDEWMKLCNHGIKLLEVI